MPPPIRPGPIIPNCMPPPSLLALPIGRDSVCVDPVLMTSPREESAITSFDGFDFREPLRVALFAGVLRGDVGAHELVGRRRADDPAAEHQDVHVVVL